MVPQVYLLLVLDQKFEEKHNGPRPWLESVYHDDMATEQSIGIVVHWVIVGLGAPIAAMEADEERVDSNELLDVLVKAHHGRLGTAVDDESISA